MHTVSPVAESRRHARRALTLGILSVVALAACRPTAPTATAAGACPHGALCVFDLDGRLVEVRHGADNNDGRVDAIEAYTYDGPRVVEATYDDLGDGTINERRRFTYVDGALHREEVDRYDDGSVDERYVYALNTDGAIVTRWEDFDDNGEAERTCAFDPPCANVLTQGECERRCDVGGGAVP